MSETPEGAVADSTEARRIVADGYDHIAERYRDWTAPHDATRAWFVDEIAARVPRGADVVELGMGSGGPVTGELIARSRHTGFDVSPAQVSLGRERHPQGDFRIADLVTLQLPDASCDAVVAAYVMGHVPIGDREDLYRRISRWIRPTGWFCASLPMGDRPGEDIESNWLGTPMFFASMPWERESHLLETAGFHIESEVAMTDDEDGEPVSFRWVFAQRPTST